MVQTWPKTTALDGEVTEKFEMLKEAITGIRAIRKEKDIANKEKVSLYIVPGEKGYIAELNPVLLKIGNLLELKVVEEEIAGAMSFMVKTSAFYIPFGDVVNVEEEIAKIKEELKYTQGFLDTVMKKMGNERFVSSAPANVVALERKKKEDAEEKISLLKERLGLIK